ncbi:MAG: hypothetical protein R3B48_13195 [Kofleriaceae bacterium]
MGVVARRTAWVVLGLATAACQGQGREPPPAPPPTGSARIGEAPAESGSGAAPAPLTAAQLIAELDAVPAWEGVVQRGAWLARRGDRGVLYGRVGPPVGEGSLLWLIDDTEGEGSLGVRAEFPAPLPLLGERVAATGAWAFRAETSRWVWQVERSRAMPQEPDRTEPAVAGAPPPGHELATVPRPPGVPLISAAKDNDLVLFQVLAAPRRLGEAWLVGDQLGSPPIAMLSLPGDRASYGGMDFRQPDEVWRLRRGVTYVVKIGRVRRRDPNKPATINARNAPRKVQ